MSIDLNQELNAAIEQHGAGNISAAETSYRRILEVNPDHPVALHLLGVLTNFLSARPLVHTLREP